jgi:plasmid stabilization system protein ParE
MDYKVILLPQALERLEQIVQLIAKDNPAAAQRFGYKLIERAELLSGLSRTWTRVSRAGLTCGDFCASPTLSTIE